MENASLSGRKRGWEGMRGRVVCRWYFTSSPLAQSRRTPIWRLRLRQLPYVYSVVVVVVEGDAPGLPRNSASVLYFCLCTGGPRGLAARVDRLGNRQAERLFLLLLRASSSILYQSCQSGVGQT